MSMIFLTEDQQKKMVNAYIAHGCNESPSDWESHHRRDINEHGVCCTCGETEP